MKKEGGRSPDYIQYKSARAGTIGVSATALPLNSGKENSVDWRSAYAQARSTNEAQPHPPFPFLTCFIDLVRSRASIQQ